MRHPNSSIFRNRNRNPRVLPLKQRGGLRLRLRLSAGNWSGSSIRLNRVVLLSSEDGIEHQTRAAMARLDTGSGGRSNHLPTRPVVVENRNISASTQALAIEPIENHEGSSKRKATSEPMESPTNHKCPALEQVEPIKLEGEKKWKETS